MGLIADVLSPERVAGALRARRTLDDAWFDRFLPEELRTVSGKYWTPLEVAVRVAEWLEQLHIRTVVDIGSGAGKFCVATALAGSARFTGLEQRARLVTAARDLARVFALDDRVTFVHGALGLGPVPEAEAYYLYNPFGENLFGPSDHLDEDVELNDGRFLRDVRSTRQFLSETPVGTYLITYNGYGGRVPWSYEEVRVDRELPNVLRMWRKTRPTSFVEPNLGERA